MDRVNAILRAVIASLEAHPSDERMLPANLSQDERKEILMRLAWLGFSAYIRESYTSGQIKTTLITERQK